jgi:type II secretory pathway pseudopilin PulG
MRNCGFTVLELLVAVGIIVLLIGILIPTVNAARRRSKVTLCASNLRQIGQAIQTYRSELRRWPEACPIPAPFTAPGWPGSTRSLPETISSYLSSRSGVYHCPGDDEVFDQCASQPNGFGLSYFYWTPFDLPKPSTTMLTDFQGYVGPLRTVRVGEFHPPRVGMNELKIDGSVEFGLANPAGP